MFSRRFERYIGMVAAGLLLLACTSIAPASSPDVPAAPSASAPNSPAPTERPSALPTETPEQSPHPISTAPPGAWLYLGPESGYGVDWSPDGRHFLETTQSLVVVRNRAGEVVANYHGGQPGQPAWIDSERFAFWSPDRDHRSYTGDVAGGEALRSNVPYGRPTANGLGATAIAIPRGNDWPDQKYDYVVWDQGGTTVPRDGFPAAWSPDGTKLAVLHAFGRERSPGGWVEVVSWPDLDGIYADEPPFATGDVMFDPSGTHIAYSSSSGDGGELEVFTRLVSLEDGQVVDLPRDLVANVYWTADGRLWITRESGAVDGYDASGQQISAARSLGTAVATSDDFSTQVFWPADGGAELHVVRDGVVTTFPTPDQDWIRVSVAPDGSALVVSNGRGAYLLLL